MAETIETKPWYLSKGLMGSIIAALPTALGILGFKLDPSFGEAVNALIVAGTTLGGAALSFWGRLTAVKKLVTK